MYFSDKPIPPSAHDPAEYERISAFRENTKTEESILPIRLMKSLPNCLPHILAQHFLSIQKVNEIKRFAHTSTAS